MFARLIVPMVVTLLVFGTAAFVAGTGTTATPAPKNMNKVQTASVKAAERCTALETQFDDAIKTHGTAKKADAAKLLRTQGETLCGKGEHKSGITRLERALRDLGVKPAM